MQSFMLSLFYSSLGEECMRRESVMIIQVHADISINHVSVPGYAK